MVCSIDILNYYLHQYHRKCQVAVLPVADVMLIASLSPIQ